MISIKLLCNFMKRAAASVNIKPMLKNSTFWICYWDSYYPSSLQSPLPPPLPPKKIQTKKTWNTSTTVAKYAYVFIDMFWKQFVKHFAGILFKQWRTFIIAIIILWNFPPCWYIFNLPQVMCELHRELPNDLSRISGN